jgi:F-type H+-transporting ATPase subunit b
MEIDWFTFAAQGVNFVLLLVLLERFLYRPILRAMDAREQRIADRIREAELKNRLAEDLTADLEAQKRELEAQREELLAAARQEAERVRAELTQAARQQVDQLQAEWTGSFERQKEAALDEFRRQAGDLVCDAVRKALAELASEELEQRMVTEFLRQVGSLTSEQRELLEQGADGSQRDVVIQTRFVLPRDQQSEIDRTLRSQLSGPVNVRFTNSDDVICGIEMKVGGRKLAWSAADHLEELRSGLARSLAEPVGAAAAAEACPQEVA